MEVLANAEVMGWGRPDTGSFTMGLCVDAAGALERCDVARWSAFNAWKEWTPMEAV